jgi:hypothetical protein
MLNLDVPLFVVLTSLAAPAGAPGHGPTAAAVPQHERTLAQGAPLRGAPPPPPPQQPVLRGRPPAPPPPPPPQPRMAPRRGFVWIDGNYEWRDGRYVWVAGGWEPERPGRRWHGGRWDLQGDRYVWIRGEWVDGPVYVPPPQAIVQTPPPAPPPPPQPTVDVQARPGFVWIPGNQEWRDGRYVWVEGHWERERRGHRWESGHWDRDGDRQYWHGGEWRRDGDGDRDERGERGDRGEHGDRGDRGDRGEHGDRGYRGAVSISGRVINRHGRPVPGVTVVLAGTSEGSAVTGPDGSYTFTGLRYGSYAVRPNGGGCNFAPDVVNLNNLASPVVQDFNAACRH